MAAGATQGGDAPCRLHSREFDSAQEISGNLGLPWLWGTGLAWPCSLLQVAFETGTEKVLWENVLTSRDALGNRKAAAGLGSEGQQQGRDCQDRTRGTLWSDQRLIESAVPGRLKEAEQGLESSIKKPHLVLCRGCQLPDRSELSSF